MTKDQILDETQGLKLLSHVAKKIVEGIWDDMSDRKGMGLDMFDGSIQQEIRKEWVEIATRVMKGQGDD